MNQKNKVKSFTTPNTASNGMKEIVMRKFENKNSTTNQK